MTPAVSQVGLDPGGGISSSTQRRQGVTWGRTARARPYAPTQAPYTQSMPSRTHTSLTRNRVSKLSVPSSTRVWPASSAPALSTARSATTPRTATSELSALRRPAAAAAFGIPRATSDSSNSDWRCRFDSST